MCSRRVSGCWMGSLQSELAADDGRAVLTLNRRDHSDQINRSATGPAA